jgi:hypothetical protein
MLALSDAALTRTEADRAVGARVDRCRDAFKCRFTRTGSAYFSPPNREMAKKAGRRRG